MVNKIKRRGVPQDGYFIEFMSKGHISTDENKLPTLDNMPVPEAVSKVAQRIFNGNFFHNVLFRRRIDQCMNSR